MIFLPDQKAANEGSSMFWVYVNFFLTFHFKSNLINAKVFLKCNICQQCLQVYFFIGLKCHCPSVVDVECCSLLIQPVLYASMFFSKHTASVQVDQVVFTYKNDISGSSQCCQDSSDDLFPIHTWERIIDGIEDRHAEHGKRQILYFLSFCNQLSICWLNIHLPKRCIRLQLNC